MGVSVDDPDGSRAAQRRALAAALTNDVTVYVIDPRGNTGGAETPMTNAPEARCALEAAPCRSRSTTWQLSH
jgi:hypothetical protein